MKTKEWGNIPEEDCSICGEKATHFIIKKNPLLKKERTYCKKCWMKEISRLGWDRI